MFSPPKIALILLFVIGSVSAESVKYMNESNWFRVGAGMTLNSDFFAHGAFNINIDDPFSLRVDLEFRPIERGTYLVAQPSIAYSLASTLQNPSSLNPYFRGGLRLRHRSQKGGDDKTYSDVSYRLLLGGGAEIYLGPQVVFEPYAHIFMWESSYAVIGFDGNYIFSPSFAAGIGFNFSDIKMNSGKLQASATINF